LYLLSKVPSFFNFPNKLFNVFNFYVQPKYKINSHCLVQE
jgi:hypothetical protein